MVLYTLNNEERDRTFFYGRVKEHIIEVVNHYRARLTPEEKANPQLHSWARDEPTLDKILEVESGVLHFVGSMIAMGEGKLFDVELQVTPDFSVAMPHESLPAFGLWRADLLSRKRGELYKAHVSHSLFGAQYFLPEDIVRAIVGHDLRPHMDAAREKLEKLETVKRGHPNLRVL